MVRKSIVFLLVVGTMIYAQESNELSQAELAIARRDFGTARAILVDIVNNPVQERSVVSEATYLLAKTELAEQNVNAAENYFRTLVQSFRDSVHLEEADYQIARMPYLREEYETAINTLGAFIEASPTSPYVANAYYWIGESLLVFGRLLEARNMFQIILDKYPTSFRVEAARYRLDLIALSLRERELRKLLLASHEQIRDLNNDLLQLQTEYDILIELYEDQNTLASGNTELAIQYAEQKQESTRLREQLQRLQDQIQAIFDTIDEARQAQ